MANCAIVGINWGDEGKGRMVDLLSVPEGTDAENQSGSAMGKKLDLNREDHARFELTDTEVILGASAAYDLGLFPNNILMLNEQEFPVKPFSRKTAPQKTTRSS